MPKINLGWLKDKNGEKFAPKTYTSQVLEHNNTPLDEKLRNIDTTLIEMNSTMTELEMILFLSEIGLVSPLINSDNEIFIDNNNNIFVL